MNQPAKRTKAFELMVPVFFSNLETAARSSSLAQESSA